MRYCIACRRQLPAQPVFKLENAPASAQNIPDAEEVGADEGIELGLYQCGHCGLVQFDCGPVDYYRDVIRAGGFSTTMKDLRRSQYRHLIDTYHLEGKSFLEVGCGGGEFLQVLTEFPVKVYGIEHRRTLVEKARGAGLQVWEEFTETGEQVLGGKEDAPKGPFDVFLSFNFLEHQPEPGVMLDCIRRNLSEGGMGLITVPSLEYILQYDGYYELLRDHIAYYTFDTLRALLESHGFEVLEEEMVNRDTLSVIVRKAGRNAVLPAEERKPDTEKKNIPPTDFSGLERSLHQIRSQAEELAKSLEMQGKTLAIWGASHQGFTLAATTCLGKKASYIIDSAPFKQGRFAPASHCPIVAPDYFEEKPVDVILIVAPGYTEEIAGIIRSRFGEGVRIMTLRSEKLEDWK